MVHITIVSHRKVCVLNIKAANSMQTRCLVKRAGKDAGKNSVGSFTSTDSLPCTHVFSLKPIAIFCMAPSCVWIFGKKALL